MYHAVWSYLLVSLKIRHLDGSFLAPCSCMSGRLMNIDKKLIRMHKQMSFLILGVFLLCFWVCEKHVFKVIGWCRNKMLIACRARSVYAAVCGVFPSTGCVCARLPVESRLKAGDGFLSPPDVGSGESIFWERLNVHLCNRYENMKKTIAWLRN